MKISVLTHTYPRFKGDINAPFVESMTEKIASLGNDVSLITAFDPEWNRIPADQHHRISAPINISGRTNYIFWGIRELSREMYGSKSGL